MIKKNLYNIIIQKMNSNRESTIEDEYISITYPDFVNLTEKIGYFFKTNFYENSKIAIICKSQVKTALLILACFKANMVPVVMSINYGEIHYKNILKVVEPNILISDYFFEEKNINYNQVLELFYKVYNYIIDNKELYNVALLMCTSGTTGLPKCAMIYTNGLLSNIKGILTYFKITNNDRILIARPLYHCAVMTGEFLVSLYQGVNIVFLNTIYNPLKVLSQIKKNITIICGTPTMFRQLSNLIINRNYSLEINKIVLSGECCFSDLANKIKEAFPSSQIFNVYGLTEASPRVCYLPYIFFKKYPYSVGIPLPEIEIKIIDNLENEVAIGKEGLVIIKGPNIMKGYYKNVELTKKVLKNGWLYTGDIGFVNNKGFLVIKSRADNLIIKAGMNIYPIEIENNLEKHKYITEALAYSYDNNNFKKIGINIVTNNAALSIKDIFKICNECLPNYMIPDKIEIVDEILKTPSGKKVR